MSAPTLQTIRDAHQRIASYIHRTPVLSSSILNDKIGAELFFKCENFQKVAAFKARGACNAVMSLTDEQARRGVVTHSSGNHGAALAWAARLRGIKATVVVPSNAPAPKKMAIAAYGANIVYCEPNVAARETATQKLIAEFGYELVHPFDDDRVIAGQGTAALEMLEAHPELDMVIAPLGGGGLLSGTSLAAKGIKPGIRVFGGEPRGADDGFRSFTSGALVTEATPNTICDGLRTVLSPRTFDIIRRNVDGIGLASEENVIKAMRMSWELLKIVIEPSSCPPLGAILEGDINVKGKRVGIVLTGGNVDLDKLPWQK
ncbi:MAG TPA: pyridoxal-phosphate dependent enzyme [Usitatibacteraceae bacterium]